MGGISIDLLLNVKVFDPVKIEETVREFWKRNKIIEKWFEPPESKEKIFRMLEGPPTTNGLMHVGHMRGRTYKDLMLRYKRLKGFYVHTPGGWDEHGLPVELEVEKMLGFKTKKDVERYGYENFSNKCNDLVDYYLKFWVEDSERLALWLDYKRAYETRKTYYINHVWAFLKYAYEKGWLVEDYRVVPFCPRCETPLSDAEVAMGYATIKDPSIFVKFKLADYENTYIVIWTTTPWTLIDNEAVAVNPDFKYVKLKVGNEYWIVAKELAVPLMGLFDIRDYEVVEEFYGSDLEGLRYIHPLEDEVPTHKKHEKPNHTIILADFVTLEQGTGCVHIAPAHGPEDFEVGKKYNLLIFNTLKPDGYFDERAGIFKNMYFKEASEKVIEVLKRKGLLIYHDVIEHEYPLCWRCDTPLVYRADKQWFLKVDFIKKKLLEENQRIKWYPSWAQKRFHDWLENAIDWCISRSRVWGTPMPIWRCTKCGHIIVVGSIEELEKLSGQKVENPHRPWIDKITLKCPKCGELMKREPFVLDCWLDSGLAWIAGINGLVNKEEFEMRFPYDWITEAVDQTRGWFYSLLFTSVMWKGITPYKSVLCQGHVLDKYGKKMSKSRGNVIWARDLFKKWGADIPRLYVISKAAPWDSIAFDVDELGEVRRQLLILWNSVRFADTYMELDKFNPEVHKLSKYLDILTMEDKYILSKVNSLIQEVESEVERMNFHIAARKLINFIVEDLSHRYIRLIRRRVWVEKEVETKYACYAVLFYVLKRVLVMLSIFTPHITEYLYQVFIRKYDKKASESVHLERWPKVDEEFINKDIEETMDLVFKIFADVAEIRQKVGIKLRWPLREVVVAVKDKIESLRKFENILLQLLNVKKVTITSELSEVYRKEPYMTISAPYGEVAVNVKLDKELLSEAYARELIRRIQAMRAELDLRVEEFIKVYIDTQDSDILSALREHEDFIKGEVRAVEITVGKIPTEAYTKDWRIEGKSVRIGVERIEGG